MVYHHTKNKGDLGVLKVKCDLCEKGWLTLSPDTEHAPFDIIAYKDGEFKRVQVKYKSLKNGVLKIPLVTSWSDKNGIHAKRIDKKEIDVMAVFCPDINECLYFIPPLKNNRLFTIRMELPKNNQSNVNLACNFKDFPSNGVVSEWDSTP